MKCVVMGSQRQTERITGTLIAKQTIGRGGVCYTQLTATDPSLIFNSQEEQEQCICMCLM